MTEAQEQALLGRVLGCRGVAVELLDEDEKQVGTGRRVCGLGVTFMIDQEMTAQPEIVVGALCMSVDACVYVCVFVCFGRGVCVDTSRS